MILGTTLVNVHVVYSELTQDNKSITEFKKDILKHIFEKHVSIQEPEAQPNLQAERHELEQTGKRLRCTVCYEKFCAEFGRKVAQNKTTRTTWSYPTCKKAYCVDCFFHSHKSNVA